MKPIIISLLLALTACTSNPNNPPVSIGPFSIGYLIPPGASLYAEKAQVAITGIGGTISADKFVITGTNGFQFNPETSTNAVVLPAGTLSGKAAKHAP